MLKFVLAALIAATSSVAAEGLSPLFGSADVAPFQMQQAANTESDSASGTSAVVWVACEEPHCPEQPKLANETQDLASAP